MTHWFLSFLYRKLGDTYWQPRDATTFGEHPLEYIHRARLTYNDTGYEYRLLFFKEIPEDVYKRLYPVDAEPGAVPIVQLTR